MNKYENIQRDDSPDKKMEVILFVNRLTYVHYDLALYYNNYKPRKYAIFREFTELFKMADKMPDFPLFDVYLALITIYYERALAKDRNLKDIRKTFDRMCKTEKVRMSFLVDKYVEPIGLDGDDEYEMYLARSVDNVISSIKNKYPTIVKRLEEIAKLNVRVTSYLSSFKIGGSSTKKTRRRREN
jgi:hypothetical protein